MPAPGDQYNGGNVQNPFEERVVNGFTAREIATLQSRLNQQLGPEYISQRPGNGGGKVAYLEGNKAIALANEVFGFNGWSSSLGQVQIDYVDEHQNGKVNLGLSIVVRITLKDGTYHEDIGYGSIENGKGKAASFEKAKKEAATDGLKRALRTFGNVLGNCLYDKEYLKKVQAMKVKPIKFKEDKLYRHKDFAPPPNAEQHAIVKQEPQRTPIRQNQLLRTRTEQLSNDSFGADFDDEADENLFDGVDLSEGHGDEFSLSDNSVSASETTGPRAVEAAKSRVAHGNGPSGQPDARPAQAGRGQPPMQQQQPNQGPGRPPPHMQNARQPHTPIQHQPRPVQNGGRMPPPATESESASRPLGQQPRNQQPGPAQPPPRPAPPQAQQASNQQRPGPQPQGTTTTATTPVPNAPPPNRPPVGFVTSRAAELLQSADATSLSKLPSFNPNAESPIPKDKRTPGVDHASSKPIKRDAVNAPPAPPPPTRPASASASSFNRPNIVNPHLDTNRRIGAPPTSYAMSPTANRGAYKPPTFSKPNGNANGNANGNGTNAVAVAAGQKRERPPLSDVSNRNGPNTAVAVPLEGGPPDAKKQRVDGNVAVDVGVGKS